jgi:hypothetical protein
MGKPPLRDAVAQVGVIAVSRVEQRHLGFDPGRQGGTKLVKRDLRFGPEDGIIGHARQGAPIRVINPLMRQIQAIRDRQAGVIVGG